MPRVLIVNMPFANPRWPAIGPSLLQAALRRRGMACDVAYFNFDFAERVGLEQYYWIADHFAFVLGGERLFARHYFGERLPDDDRYWRDVLLAADPELTGQDRLDFEQTQLAIEPFLDACMAAVEHPPDSGPPDGGPPHDVVGFAASFQQTMPSLCLARRIKRLRPTTKIVFGGAACEAEMGVELLRQFECIDYVFLGEADLTFPAVVEQLLQGGPVTLPPGVVGRESPAANADAQRPAPPAAELPNLEPSIVVRNLDALPYPDFDDYFARHAASPLRDRIDPLLFFETSRGCWWGERHHCVFCGLNGRGLAFRSKSPRRAVDELRHLVERYGVRKACSADNILDRGYFDTLLPMLRDARLGLAFEYEMKTNLTRGQVRTLLDAGLGAAQLGIETFVTQLLKAAGKGATAMQNLQTLKWFSESGIEVKWNLLYGFPGEDPADYAALAGLLPSLYHLAPPLAVGRVRMDRFAPYFENPAAYGMTNPRPNRAFACVYPFPEDVLARLAYYYEYDYADGRNPADYAGPTLAAAAAWQQLAGTVALRCFDRSDGVLILTDTRPGAEMLQRRLTGVERSIYLHCDPGRSLSEIETHLAEAAGADAPDRAALRRLLDQWIEARILAQLDGRYLGLALRPPSGAT